MKNQSNTVKTLHRALHHAENYLLRLDQESVGAQIDLETLRERLDVELQLEEKDSIEVIDALVDATKEGLLGSAGGRFFAWVIGGSLPSALAADWLTTTWDQNAALYATGPAVSVIEEVAGKWLKELLDLPREASFAFTTGCQLAHFTSLAAARYALLKQQGWDVNTEGLHGAPPIRVLTSAHRHHSIDRAVRFLGLGSRSLVSLPTDDDERVRPEVLAAELECSEHPAIVVLDAADLNVAAFDLFHELIPIAKAAGAWVHIDGAFGLISRASKRQKHWTDGVELADSWATDAHKWLNVPFDCGIAFIRDREAHRHSMTVSATYIEAEGKARDQIDWNPEWSRKARGVPVYAALRELGRSGLENLVDSSCCRCRDLVEGIGNLAQTEVVWTPKLNQGLVRFIHPSKEASDKDHDWMTDEVIRRTNLLGEAFFSGTTWKNRRAMRISVVNWKTSPDDVTRSIKSVAASIDAILVTEQTKLDN